MNEQTVSSLLESEYPPLEQAIADLRGHNEQLERFVEQLLGEISALSDEFETKALELAQRTAAANGEVSDLQTLEAQNHQLTEQIESRDRELAALKEELSQLRSETSITVSAESGDGAESPESAIAHQLRQQVESLRQELASTKIELLKKSKQVNPAANDHANLSMLKRQNEELEGELHRVRGRAAQLTETLDRRERELKQQQQAWAGEMQSMREMLGSRGQASASPSREPSFSDTSLASGTATVVRDDMERRSSGNTAVVDSVLAQFAKIQRDVSRRRAQQKTS